jgi:hypothetical protein
MESPPLKEALLLTIEEAYRRAFRINLSSTEQVSDAQVGVWPTTLEEQARGYPPGIVVCADLRFHGADVHLTWEQAVALSTELRRLLDEHDSLEP